MAINLLSLPREVLHNILLHVDPPDAAHFSCCRTLHSIIKSDVLLSKELYLRHFDDPRAKGETEYTWEEQLHNVVRVGKILESDTEHVKKAHFEAIARTIEELIRCSKVDIEHASPSRNLLFLKHHLYHNRENQSLFLSSSSIYKWAAATTWQANSECIRYGRRSSRRRQEEEAPSEAEVKEQEAAPSSTPTSDGQSPQPSTVEKKICQISAKLHVLSGIPLYTVFRPTSHPTNGPQRYLLRNFFAPIHPYVRSLVYDLRQHTPATRWGPFLPDGQLTTDWEKMEALMLILYHNTSSFASAHPELVANNPHSIPDWEGECFSAAVPDSYRPCDIGIGEIVKEPALPLEQGDPYGVTGIWMRIVCFLDYTELFGFNFSTPPPASVDQPRPPLDMEEAIRLITMKLVVSKIEEPGEGDGKGLPVVWFKGESSSIRPSWDPNANSGIRGSVRLTPEGEVHWTSWSIFHGEERWKSEGVQVGGVRSKRGVLGYWFDKDFDPHGPAGPTMFWKSHDGIETASAKARDGNDTAAAAQGLHHLHALHMPMY